MTRQRPGTTPASEPSASVLDTIDGALRAYLGSMDATSAAVQVWLVLHRAGMLNKEFVVDVDRRPGTTSGPGWQPIATAPTDGSFVWVYTAAYGGLPAFQSWCAWHPDAGWCTDELRPVTHWVSLQAVWLSPPEQERVRQNGRETHEVQDV